MKTYFNLLLVFFLFTILLSGCSGSNGKTGAAGPTMPVIQSLSIQGVPAMPGCNMTATVNAQSAQGLGLTYTWTTSSNQWKITGGGNTPTATIQAAGGYAMTGTATIEVSDTNGMYAMGSIALSTQGDIAPVINSITASPNPILPNSTMIIVVNTYDAQRNQLQYQWASTAFWQITGYPTTGSQATATVIAPPTYGTGGYVTVTVSDKYGDAVTGTIGLGTAIIIPSPPVNLQRSLPSPSSVLLTWNTSGYATSYTIYASEFSGGQYTAVGTTTTTSYTVTGTNNSKAYYFVVTAQNNIGMSGYSNQVSNIILTNTYAVGTGPYGIAIDSAGNVWVANSVSHNVIELNSSGTTIGTYAAATAPYGIAIDSAGNVWVTNSANNNVIELNSSGTTIGTYAVGTGPFGIAIDSSGDVWVTNFRINNVTELMGLATASNYWPYIGPQWP